MTVVHSGNARAQEQVLLLSGSCLHPAEGCSTNTLNAPCKGSKVTATQSPFFGNHDNQHCLRLRGGHKVQKVDVCSVTME